MSDDIRDLLVEIAPEPSRRLDVDALVASGRRRRRSHRVLVAVGALAVAVALGGSVVAVSSGGGETPLAVRAGSLPSSIPAGWTPVNVDGAGISLAIPPGWTRAAAGDVSDEVLTVGDAPRPGRGPINACGSSGAPAAFPAGVTGSWVSLYEYPAGSTAISAPGGDTIQMSAVPARPADFRVPTADRTTCSSQSASSASTTAAGPPATAQVSTTTNEFQTFVFVDGGREFLAHITTIGTADPDRALEQGGEVLNTLRVEPTTGGTTTTAGPDTATTTTGPDTATTTTTPTDTTPSGTNGGAGIADPAAEAEIRATFLGWLRGKTLDDASAHIEDFASIRDAEAQGIAQHTPQDLAGFDGRVESVVIADATHADVVYTVLHDGQPLYANRPGKAVEVGGKWMVTRDTACALLSLGGITCSPRTTPTP